MPARDSPEGLLKDIVTDYLGYNELLVRGAVVGRASKIYKTQDL